MYLQQGVWFDEQTMAILYVSAYLRPWESPISAGAGTFKDMGGKIIWICKFVETLLYIYCLHAKKQQHQWIMKFTKLNFTTKSLIIIDTSLVLYVNTKNALRKSTHKYLEMTAIVVCGSNSGHTPPLVLIIEEVVEQILAIKIEEQGLCYSWTLNALLHANLCVVIHANRMGYGCEFHMMWSRLSLVGSHQEECNNIESGNMRIRWWDWCICPHNLKSGNQ